MRKTVLLLLLMFSVVELIAQVHVRGYYRRDGTYVQPHYRSNPDGNPYNNWSYPGNTNPYTGKVATGDPDTYLKNYYNRSSNSKANSSTDYSTSLPSFSNSNTGSFHSNSLPSNSTGGDSDKWLRAYEAEIEKTRNKNQRELDIHNYNTSSDYTIQSYNHLMAVQDAIRFHDRYSFQDRTILEEALNESGYDVGIVDGIFDENTIRAIKVYQKSNNLKADGRLGNASINKLGYHLK